MVSFFCSEINIIYTFGFLHRFTSAISILGNSSEMYNFGTQFALTIFSFFVMVPVTAYLYLPTFRELGITSIYEVSLALHVPTPNVVQRIIFQYFNRRFSNGIRLLMAGLFVIQSVSAIILSLKSQGISKILK